MSFLFDLWVPKEMCNLPAYQRLRRKTTITMVVLGSALVAYVPPALAFPQLNLRPFLLLAVLVLSAILFYWMSPETKEIREWRRGRDKGTHAAERI